MSVEELKQVVEKWKNEDGTERAALLVTAEGCDNGESQCTDMAMRGDRERLITALQAIFNVEDAPLRAMVCLALSNCTKMKPRLFHKQTFKKKEKLIKFIVCAAIILATFKFAGDMDRTEHAIMLMSDTEYEEIKDSLSNIHNSEPSEKQIANEWYSRKGN